MPRFCANLSMLFTEHAWLDRFQAAADAGFKAVEIQFPYDWPPEVLAQRCHQAGLQLVLHNLPAGNWEAGDRGIACDPARRAEFELGVEQAIRYALALGCTQLNCLSGIPPPTVPERVAQETFVANLRLAARALHPAGIRLLIEPINRRDVPGFFLERIGQAARIADAVAAENLFIQLDVYHAQRTEGELTATLAEHLSRIAHIQVADNPGRHEPGSGEINYRYLFEQIDRLGYSGWIGCEYRPLGATRAGLGWIEQLARASDVHSRPGARP
ncbi:MAG: hydroxypyruvate isomerase [Rhodocyclaceae bacterium]|nr:hydroxypyruvate isomerase [Rhodocyclaceae bacterium]